eukprot:gene3095-5865_t
MDDKSDPSRLNPSSGHFSHAGSRKSRSGDRQYSRSLSSRTTKRQHQQHNLVTSALQDEKEKQFQEVLKERMVIAAKLEEAQRRAKEHKQMLLHCFGSMSEPSYERSRRNSARSEKYFQEAIQNSSSIKHSSSNHNLPTDYHARDKSYLEENGRQNMSSNSRPDSTETVIPSKLFIFDDTTSRDQLATLIFDIVSWRKQYIERGGMNPVTMERLHTAEERARQARIELQKTNRKDQEAFSLPKKQTPIKDAENFDRESRQPSEDGVHSSLLTQTQRNKDPPHVPNRTDLSHTEKEGFDDQNQTIGVCGDLTFDPFFSEEEREESHRLRRLHQQTNILRQEAELKRLQQELSQFDQSSKDTEIPVTPPEQSTDVLNPGPYDSEEGFVVFFDFACRLPPWLRRCSIRYAMYSVGKAKSKFQTSLPADTESMAECSQDMQLFICKFIKAQFVARNCPPIPSLHLLIELRNRAGASDEGSLAAWCKLYLFSQQQLVSGRWRLRLLQPPVDEKCFSTDLLTSPSFNGADLCVRLVDKRAQPTHDQLPVDYKRHLYLPNGVIGQDVIHILQLKAAQLQQQQNQQRRNAQVQEAVINSKSNSARSRKFRAPSQSNTNQPERKERSQPNSKSHSPSSPINLRGIKLKQAYSEYQRREMLPLNLNITASIGYMQGIAPLLDEQCDKFQYSTNNAVHTPVNQRISIRDFELRETFEIMISFELMQVPPMTTSAANNQGTEDTQLSDQWKTILMDELPKPDDITISQATPLLHSKIELSEMPLLEPTLSSSSLTFVNASANGSADKYHGTLVLEMLVQPALPIHVGKPMDIISTSKPLATRGNRRTTAVGSQAIPVRQSNIQGQNQADFRTALRTRNAYTTSTSYGGIFDHDNSREISLEQALKLIPDGAFLLKHRIPTSEVHHGNSGFDVYIDGARFLPYNVTVSK